MPEENAIFYNLKSKKKGIQVKTRGPPSLFMVTNCPFQMRVSTPPELTQELYNDNSLRLAFTKACEGPTNLGTILKPRGLMILELGLCLGELVREIFYLVQVGCLGGVFVVDGLLLALHFCLAYTNRNGARLS